MTDLAKLRQDNEARWAKAVINAGDLPTIDSVARRLINPTAQARYKTVSAKTGVPANFIAVVHEREASQNWNTQLGQGDPLHQVSTHVPKGRGPFDTWEDGAYDALVNCPPYAARNKDWSIGGLLTMLEQYNGLGYANKGVPSPYIWSKTNQYVKGKYVADGVYDPNAVDKQIGCAALLKRMDALQGVQPAPTPVPVPPKPRVQPKHLTGITAIIAAIVAAIESHSTEFAIGIIAAGIAVAVALHFLWKSK